MSYVAAIDALHALAQELAPASASTPRRKFDIAHMRVLAAALGNPQDRFPSILIAGTNGKGSTASTLASILAASGLRTGLYTSPHLSRVTERIRVLKLSTSNPEPRTSNLSDISEDDFARLYFHVDETAQRLVTAGELPHHPSFFECLTALAFLHFAGKQPDGSYAQPVDIAVLEVGMGGRLDATNIVSPLLSVITDIALDHQEYLGSTLAEIAREKAGILRQDGLLITLPQHPEANQAIGEVAMALHVRGVNAADYLPDVVRSPSSVDRSTAETDNGERTTNNPLTGNHYDLHIHGETLHVRSPLAGEHQRRNLALAIAAAIEISNIISYKFNSLNLEPRTLNLEPRTSDLEPRTSDLEPRTSNLEPRTSNLLRAIEAGITHTTWPGRLEFLPPDVLLDVAHNPAGAWTLRAAIATLPEARPRTLIFSCLRDKDLTEMARILLPLFDSAGDRPQDHIVFAPINNPRAAPLDDLLATARSLDIPAQAAGSPVEALALARSLTPAGGLILATGSIYLVGAIREAVLGR